MSDRSTDDELCGDTSDDEIKEQKCPMSSLTRRGLFKSAGKGLSLLALSPALELGVRSRKAGADEIRALASSKAAADSAARRPVIPFYGKNQAGIVTPQQSHTYFLALDLTTDDRKKVLELLKTWTAAADRMTRGMPAQPVKDGVASQRKTAGADGEGDSGAGSSYSSSSSFSSKNEFGNASEGGYADGSVGGSDSEGGKGSLDSGDAIGLSSARLTLTFGFGPTLFVTKQGKDRYGLARFKPEALSDLPRFHGDQLVDEKGGGDLSVQACADDPQVAFHAVRQLVRLASDVAQVRWAQTGFLSGAQAGRTPRNLMGFKDGTQQPNAKDHNRFVWAAQEGPRWMREGSYLVVRKIRIALEHWDRTEVDFQEEVIGRYKDSGAPLGKKRERDSLDLARAKVGGDPVIADNAHVRLANFASNGGAQILRRGYSYNDGVSFVAERWPPWHQGIEYDAGLFFVSYQSDPRTGFTRIFQNMAKIDALNQFATHVGSALFACPPGVRKGEFIGQGLFEMA